MIKFEEVSKIYNLNKYDEKIAVKNINLSIENGKITVITGSSGSGKTTLLNLISAVSKPTQGAVYVNDLCVSKLPDNFASEYRRKQIGFIFQDFNLLKYLTVSENILLPQIPQKNKSHMKINNLEMLLERFNLENIAHKKVKYLSGGEQQRVAIARALINNPEIILADEPSAHLDAELCENLLSYLEELNNEGKTIIIATHDDRFLKLKGIFIEIKNGEIC